MKAWIHNWWNAKSSWIESEDLYNNKKRHTDRHDNRLGKITANKFGVAWLYASDFWKLHTDAHFNHDFQFLVNTSLCHNLNIFSHLAQLIMRSDDIIYEVKRLNCRHARQVLACGYFCSQFIITSVGHHYHQKFRMNTFRINKWLW